MADKFNEADRQRVQRALEKCLGTKLSKLTGYRKVTRDQSGRIYLIIGGYAGRGNWHGIEAGMISDLRQRQCDDAVLVIAQGTPANTLIFQGPLWPLLQHADQLSAVAKTGQRQFHLHQAGSNLVVKEVPEIVLEPIVEC